MNILVIGEYPLIVHLAIVTGDTPVNVAGVRIQSVKGEGSDKHLDLNLKKGCYILKVGKTVRKVSLK